jgi:hypothetical protein
MDGYHDDCLMAMAMCLWVIEHSFKNLERLEKQNKAILSSWTVSGSNLNKEKASGTKTIKDNKQNNKPFYNPYMVNNPQNPIGQYGWLFKGLMK